MLIHLGLVGLRNVLTLSHIDPISSTEYGPFLLLQQQLHSSISMYHSVAVAHFFAPLSAPLLRLLTALMKQPIIERFDLNRIVGISDAVTTGGRFIDFKIALKKGLYLNHA